MKSITVNVAIQLDLPNADLDTVLDAVADINNLLAVGGEEFYHIQILSNAIDTSDITIGGDEPSIVNIKFGQVVVKLEGNQVGRNLNLGSLKLERNGREFILDTVQSYRDYDEKNNITTVRIDLEVDTDTFPLDEYGYDLTAYDLTADDLVSEFYFTPDECADGQETDMKLVQCYLELTIINEPATIEIIIDSEWKAYKIE